MKAALILFSAYFGACLASFVLAAAERTLEEKKWYGAERSKCDSCGKTLTAAELFPIFSFLFQKGRCKNCKAEIPRESLIVEFIGVFCGALFAARFCFSPALLFCHTAFLFLLFSALTDIKSGYIYDNWAFAMAGFGLAERLLFGGFHALADGISGALAGFALLFAIYLLSRKKGMGLGDAYLMLGFGAIFGWKITLLGLYCAFFAGGCTAAVLLLAKKASRKTALPLVPFLATGALLAVEIYPAVFGYLGITADLPF
ncbi:MAG: prepilin peptidase [Synergistaceae bacterium]|nr:prepilin peptidase [Synergistaceae bacterium]